MTPGGKPTTKERLTAELVVLENPLRIIATTNGFGGHQIMLQHVNSPGNLARLCDDSAHQHQVHWHHFEDMPGLDEERSDLNPPLTGGSHIDATTLSIEHFAPAINLNPDSYWFKESLL